MPRKPGKTLLLFVAWAALAAAATHADFKPSTTCKFLTADEAAEVIGAGAKLQSAIEDGACTFVRGPLTLTVQQPFTYSDPKIVVQTFETMANDKRGEPVPGLGERAYRAKGNSGWSVAVLTGGNLFGMELYGEGSDGVEMAKKLEAAARVGIGRL